MKNIELIKQIIHTDTFDLTKDLHMHSYFSDGELSPTDLMYKMKNQGVKVVSLTDHDGIAGNKEALEVSTSLGMKFVNGIEISAHHFFCEKFIGMHILGYGIDCSNTELLHMTKKFEANREKRNFELFKIMQQEGYDIKEEDAIFRKEQPYIGKALIAKALIKKGYINSVGEAFGKDGIFDKPNIRRVSKSKLLAKDAIDLIHRSGGVAVLAHPGRIKGLGMQGTTEFYKKIEELTVSLKSINLNGIESWYRNFSKEEMDFFAQIGKRNSLILTGGSDFHSESALPEPE